MPAERNTTFIYTGEFYSPTNTVSFGANIRQAFMLLIDGVIPARRRAKVAAVPAPCRRWSPTPTTRRTICHDDTLYLGPGSPDPLGRPGGWHTIDFRFSNNAGNQGPAQTFPFSIAPGGTAAVQPTETGASTVNQSFMEPVDNGNMNVFRVRTDASHYVLNKQGPGTLDLQGANTYTGGTQVNSGDLRVWHERRDGPVRCASAVVDARSRNSGAQADGLEQAGHDQQHDGRHVHDHRDDAQRSNGQCGRQPGHDYGHDDAGFKSPR